jgi:hypothetical protein
LAFPALLAVWFMQKIPFGDMENDNRFKRVGSGIDQYSVMRTHVILTDARNVGLVVWSAMITASVNTKIRDFCKSQIAHRHHIDGS